LLRKTENRQAATSRSEAAKKLREERRAKHISNENFNSVVYEVDQAICLHQFQDLLCTPEEAGGISNSIARAKGFITFDIHSNYRYIFHWSGRRRYQILLDGECVVAKSRMVFIGNLTDSSTLDKVAATTIPSTGSDIQKQLQDTLELIRTDPMFEILESNEEAVYFRVTGVSTTSLSMQELDERFGIDFDKMNEDLARSVNSSPGKNFAIDFLLLLLTLYQY